MAGYMQAPDGRIYYKFTRGTADGSTVSDYGTTSYSGYLSGPTTSGQTSATAIKTMTALTTGAMLPTALSGSNSTYYCDNF